MALLLGNVKTTGKYWKSQSLKYESWNKKSRLHFKLSGLRMEAAPSLGEKSN